MELYLLNKLQGTLLWFNFYRITSHYFENAPSRIVYDVDTRNFHIFAISQKLLKGSVALFNQRINFSTSLMHCSFLGDKSLELWQVRVEISFLLGCGAMSLSRQAFEVPLRQLASQVSDRHSLGSL